MNSNFTVLFDSCVFYQAPVRDILLELSQIGLFRGRWTKRINQEWVEGLLKNRPDLKRANIERTCERMNSSVKDCLVSDYENILIEDSLPDPNDKHVLCAAIQSKSQVIVTYNLKDFPNEILNKYSIEAQHPDTFLRYQMDLDLATFLFCVKTIRLRLNNPPRSANEYLFSLFQNIPNTVNELKRYSFLI